MFQFAHEGVRNFEFCEGLEGYDTPENDKWLVHDSSAQAYFGVKLQDCPEGPLGIIEDQLASQHNNTAIDIAGGSNDRALMDLIGRGVIEKGLVTTYSDRRSETAKYSDNIDQLTGDILSPDTWGRMWGWQDQNSPGGASLILHRPVGALQSLPPSFYKGAIHTLLDNLRSGGVIFSTIPSSLISSNKHEVSPLRDICNSIRSRDDVDKLISSPNIQGVFRSWFARHVLITKE